jgi:hypothetical protein
MAKRLAGLRSSIAATSLGCRPAASRAGMTLEWMKVKSTSEIVGVTTVPQDKLCRRHPAVLQDVEDGVTVRDSDVVMGEDRHLLFGGDPADGAKRRLQDRCSRWRSGRSRRVRLPRVRAWRCVSSLVLQVSAWHKSGGPSGATCATRDTTNDAGRGKAQVPLSGSAPPGVSQQAEGIAGPVGSRSSDWDLSEDLGGHLSHCSVVSRQLPVAIDRSTMRGAMQRQLPGVKAMPCP